MGLHCLLVTIDTQGARVTGNFGAQGPKYDGLKKAFC